MAEPLERCPACNGRGETRCDCWPGDCYCGFGDETCEECMGSGVIHPDDDYWPEDEDYDALPPAPTTGADQ